MSPAWPYRVTHCVCSLLCLDTSYAWCKFIQTFYYLFPLSQSLTNKYYFETKNQTTNQAIQFYEQPSFVL